MPPIDNDLLREALSPAMLDAGVATHLNASGDFYVRATRRDDHYFFVIGDMHGGTDFFTVSGVTQALALRAAREHLSRRGLS